TNLYKGRTTRSTGIVATSTTVTCVKTDGFNTIGFGALPGKILGITCYWYDGTGAAIEADMKLDGQRKWFAAPAVPGGCSGIYSVRGVATHEFGHVFGLGHVAE